jgi:amino acid transporter
MTLGIFLSFKGLGEPPKGSLRSVAWAVTSGRLAALWLQNAIATIISFASVGIYIASQMIVIAALVARGRGWRPGGSFSLGAWGWAVNIAALIYGLCAIVNMSWPRGPNDPVVYQLRRHRDIDGCDRARPSLYADLAALQSRGRAGRRCARPAAGAR